MRMTRAGVVVALVVLVGAGGVLAWRAQRARQRALEKELYVAVPMGMFVPFAKVAEQFEKSHPGLEILTLIDTPETMAKAVMENKDKPDVFISPGGHEASVLREKGLLEPKSMVAFGSYQVALLVPKANPGKVKRIEDLLKPTVKIISFSYPDMTAASHAACQALQTMGLWDKLTPKIKFTGCCNESYQWILDGRAEANVQFLGCPLDPKTAEVVEKSKTAFICLFPEGTCYIPRNVAGIVTTTKRRRLAEEFIAFLTAPKTQEFMAKNRMPNDAKLPLVPGPWGPEQELPPTGGGAP